MNANADGLGGMPPTIELGGAAVARTEDAINKAILSPGDGEVIQETLGQAGEASGQDSVSDGSRSSPQKTFDKVREEWYYIASMALRVTKGLFFNRKKIAKDDYGKCSDIWTEYLAKKYPDGVDDSELIMALLATGAMFTGADDRPETDEDKQPGVWAYLKRIGKALVGG